MHFVACNSDDNFEDTKSFFNTNGDLYWWSYNDWPSGSTIDGVWSGYYHFGAYPTKVLFDRDGYARMVDHFWDSEWETTMKQCAGL